MVLQLAADSGNGPEENNKLSQFYKLYPTN